MKFDIAIVSYNTDFHLLNVLTSIRKAFAPGAFGLCHVWDNGSTDQTGEVLDAVGREVDWLRPHRSATNLHHGPALDRLLREHCAAEWVLALDSDTSVRHDFRPALPRLCDEQPAFIGQVHPEPRELYAYLCHLLVNRAWYLDLPPFDRDGAPGRAFFRAVVERGIHWRRFRWVDHVDHLGQGTLHVVLQRGETTHPFYAFADEQRRRNPRWAAAQTAEEPLRRSLAVFLAERGIPPAGGTAGVEPAADAASPAPAPAGADPSVRRRRRRARWDGLPFPAARVVRIAAGLGLGQPPAELRQLFRLVRYRRPQTVLEVGRAAGGTLFLWTRAAAARATVVSLGPPPWEIDDPGDDARRRALAACGRPRQRVAVLREDPLTAAARARVETHLAGRALGFLFLTGEDDVGWIRDALDLYAPLVKAGGLVALDGIRPRLGGTDRVHRFWRDVQARVPARELVADPARPGAGIGVIRIRRETPGRWWRGDPSV